MYRAFFLALSRNQTFKRLLVACPLTKGLVKRFIAGESWETARDGVAGLIDKGLKVTLDPLGEDVTCAQKAEAAVVTYLALLDTIRDEGWAGDAEVAVKLTALGLLLRDGEALATANARRIAAKAAEVGTTITIDMENLGTTAKTIRTVQALREDFPTVGCTLQACLRRTETDCCTVCGARVRLTKGAYRIPPQAAYTVKHDVDLCYVRCLKTLMEGSGTPLVATHDPVMIEIAQELAAHSNRGLRDFEFQMLYGVRPIEQERLADLGYIVRVYVPFGRDWYAYLVRRLAERAANLRFLLRSLVGPR
ncbi:MAG: proline dehydrogenase family protein [Propionibacteriaceae bacterium]|jgi:proline dehydrogenase|nr:proline dehydrogenase family protein [Propionibacteriaceae bacterium]